MDYKKLSRICDSVSESPTISEFWDKFEFWADSDEDKTVIELSKPLSKEEIAYIESSYNRHNDPDDPEFVLSIKDLGENKYEVSCPFMGAQPVSDSKPYKGDFIKGKTPGGMRVEGRLVEEVPEGYRVKTPDNKTFYIITRESAENATLEAREKQQASNREQSIRIRRAEHFEKKIAELEDELERVSLDMEQDPDVLDDPDNGDNPAVIEYGEKMTKIQNKLDNYRRRLAEIQ